MGLTAGFSFDFAGFAGAAALGAAAAGLAGTAAVVSLLYAVINRFISHPIINAAARWIGMPLAAIYMFGQMGTLINWLDSVAFSAGNIRISAGTDAGEAEGGATPRYPAYKLAARAAPGAEPRGLLRGFCVRRNAVLFDHSSHRFQSPIGTSARSMPTTV